MAPTITAVRFQKPPTSWEGRVTIYVHVDNTSSEEPLFSYYPDEIDFDESELLGLTVDAARALRRQRDQAYLQSP